MINQLIKKYNALEGEEVSRDALNKLSTLAFDAIAYDEKIAGEIHSKLNKILDKYDKDKFEVKSLKKYSLQKTASVNTSKQKEKKKFLPGNSAKNKKQESGLKAPRHNGAAKNALSECGRLKKGFRYEKGGKIVKIKKQTKKKASGQKVSKKQNPVPLKKIEPFTKFYNRLKNEVDAYLSIERKSIKLIEDQEIQRDFQDKKQLKKFEKNFSLLEGKMDIGFNHIVKLTKRSNEFVIGLIGNRIDRKQFLSDAKWAYSQLNAAEKPVKKTTKKESVKKPVKSKPNQEPVKVDTYGQTALFGAIKQPFINFEVVESTNIVHEPVKESALPVAPVLNAPALEVPLKVPGREVKKEVKQVTSKSRFKTSFELLNDTQVQNELFTINNPYWSKFLGKVEKKPKQSMVITIDSGEGGGKTHTAFQFAQVMASSGYRPIIWSLEEHKDSNLSKDKQRKYFDEDTQKVIVVESEDNDLTYEENYTRIKESVSEFDVIIIDSYAKLHELNSKINFDTGFRKKFNGKLFFVIFQRTADGKMRGGAKGAFDGDIILKVDVDRADFRNNFIFNHKNRYNDYMPISELKFSPFHQKLIDIENEPTAQPTLLNYEVVG